MTDATYMKYCPACGAEHGLREFYCACGTPLAEVPPEPRRAPVLDAACGTGPAAPGVDAPATDVAAAADTAPEPGGGQFTVPDTLRRSTRAQCFLEYVPDPGIRFPVKDGQTLGANRNPAKPADVSLDLAHPGVALTIGGLPADEVKLISSCHARLYYEDGQWYVQHLGTTNYIKVNASRVDSAEPVPLHHRDFVSFTRTQFRVLLDGA